MQSVVCLLLFKLPLAVIADVREAQSDVDCCANGES
jgi:hypothetical protein